MSNVSDNIIDELQKLSGKMRLKAEACRKSANSGSKGLFGDGSRFSLFQEGKAVGLNFWMCRSDYQLPDDLTRLKQLADWFDVTGDAVDLLLDAARTGITLSSYIQLAATANKYLGAIVINLHDRYDAEQATLYGLLLSAAKELGIYVPGLKAPEHLPTDDNLLTVLEDLEKGRQRLNLTSVKSMHLHLLKQVVAKHPQTEEEWEQLVEEIRVIVAEGTKPNNVQLRNTLLPVLEAIPESALSNTHVASVMREIDKFLSENPEIDAQLDHELPTIDVPKVRNVVSGQRLLMIGGHQRPAVRQQLIAAFDLKDLVWLTVKPHQKVVPFNDDILEKHYAAVMLSLRFGKHLIGQLTNFCDKTHTPLIQLHAGYNRNQVAREILNQACVNV